MKRKFTILTAALALLACLAIPLGMWGQTKTEGFEKASTSTTYNSTVTIDANQSDCGIAWTIYYGCVSTNNKISGNNSAQMRWYSSATSNLPYLQSTTAVDGLTNLAFKARVGNTNVKMDVNYSSDGTNWTAVATAVTFTAANTAYDYTYAIPSGGKYIKIGVSSSSTAPSSGNYAFIVDDVVFTYSGSVNTYTVTYHANVTGTTDIVETYYEGDDVTVAANTFSNPGYSFTKWNTNEGGTGTDYQPGAVIEDIDDDWDFYAQWEESNEIVDVLTYSLIGVTGTSYTEWSGKTSNSTAVYAGKTAGGNNSIQLNATTTNGIISTTSGGNVRNITLTWNTHTSSGRKIIVYGSNTAFSSISAMTNTTELGEIAVGSTSLDITGDYAYVGIVGSGGACYLDEIDIAWEPVAAPAVATPTFNPVDGTVIINEDYVLLECATENASIYYTMGDNPADPTNESTPYNSDEGIEVTQSTTIKAIAYVGDEHSSVATASYTVLTPLTTMDAIYSAATTANDTPATVAITFNNWIVTGVGLSSNIYKRAFVTDGTKGFIIYNNNESLTFQRGDVLSGSKVCQVKLLNGAPCVMGLNASDFNITQTGAVPTVTSTTINALSAVNTGAVVDLGQLTWNGSYFVDGNTPADEHSIYNYNTIYSATLVANKEYNVKGVYVYYTGNSVSNHEIAPRDANDILEVTNPEIVIDADDLQLAYTANEEGNFSVSYTNGYVPELASATLYSNEECTTPFPTSGGEAWIILGDMADPYTSIDYMVDANPSTTAPRTVYMKVEAYDAEEHYLYGVFTITQAVSPEMAYFSYSVNGDEGQTLDAVVGSTINLPPAEDLNSDFTFAGWTTDPNDVTNLINQFTFNEEDVYVFYAVYAHTTGGAGTRASMMISSETENFPSSYDDFAEYNLNGKNFMIRQVYKNGTKLQFRSATNSNGAGIIYNSESLGTISSIVLNYNSSDSNKNFTIKAGSFVNPTDGIDITPTINGSEYTFALSSGNYSYFVLTNGEGAGYLDNIIINYSAGSPQPTPAYYTRVFLDETISDDIEIVGPSIIPSGQMLDMGEHFLFSVDPASLIVEDGGQLYTNDVVEATIQKNISAYNNPGGTSGTPDGWYFISSPLNGAVDPAATATNPDEGQYVANLIPTNSDQVYDLYEYDPNAEKEWVNYKHHTTDFKLYTGHGYLYANANDVTLEFAGSLNYYDEDFNSLEIGWNLVGNPYTYNAYPSMPYYKMNDAGTAIESTESTGAIAPCTGILVNNEDGTTTDITFSRTAPNAKGGINLALAEAMRGATKMDNAIVSFNKGSQLSKFYFGTQNANLYIPQGTEEYAIVNAEAQGEMPVNFRANEDGQYTLTVNPENVDMNYLHLIDNMTGMDVDLLQTPSYTFNATTRDYESRFRLVFAANNKDGVSTGSTTFAFYSNGNWIINNAGEATLQVVDLTGRILSSETVNGSVSKTINAVPGVYMLRLINGENVNVQKIVVR